MPAIDGPRAAGAMQCVDGGGHFDEARPRESPGAYRGTLQSGTLMTRHPPPVVFCTSHALDIAASHPCPGTESPVCRLVHSFPPMLSVVPCCCPRPTDRPAGRPTALCGQPLWPAGSSPQCSSESTTPHTAMLTATGPARDRVRCFPLSVHGVKIRYVHIPDDVNMDYNLKRMARASVWRPRVMCEEGRGGRWGERTQLTLLLWHACLSAERWVVV